jgi:uncharacterized UPF0160 family protein
MVDRAVGERDSPKPNRDQADVTNVDFEHHQNVFDRFRTGSRSIKLQSAGLCFQKSKGS